MLRKILVAIVVAAFAARLAADDRLEMRRDPVVKAVEKTAGAVVNISTEKVVQRGFFHGENNPFGDPFFEQFMGRFARPEVAHSLGSGGIFTPDGYIFTNAHVVDRASKVLVTLEDGKQYPAELVNVDLVTDLAVIKIDAPEPLPTLVLGRSDDLMAGEKAIAVGNPFGLANTVTTGTISAVHRDVVVEGRALFKDFLQTDALINPGNSGGPLLNIFGEVVGVNAAMRANAQGIGFAIPVDRVKRSLAALMDYRKLRRLKVGLDLEEVRRDSGPLSDLVVKGVPTGGPADRAGVKIGDVLTGAGGRPLSSLVDFMAVVLALDGESLDVAVRRGEEILTLSVTPDVIPKPDGEKLALSMLGLSVQQMSKALARDVGINLEEGILVAGVAGGSSAAKAGLETGDVIQQVNDNLTADMDSFAAALEAAQRGKDVYLVILRRRGRTYYQFALEVPLAGMEKS